MEKITNLIIKLNIGKIKVSRETRLCTIERRQECALRGTQIEKLF